MVAGRSIVDKQQYTKEDGTISGTTSQSSGYNTTGDIEKDDSYVVTTKSNTDEEVAVKKEGRLAKLKRYGNRAIDAGANAGHALRRNISKVKVQPQAVERVSPGRSKQTNKGPNLSLFGGGFSGAGLKNVLGGGMTWGNQNVLGMWGGKPTRKTKRKVTKRGKKKTVNRRKSKRKFNVWGL